MACGRAVGVSSCRRSMSASTSISLKSPVVISAGDGASSNAASGPGEERRSLGGGGSDIERRGRDRLLPPTWRTANDGLAQLTSSRMTRVYLQPAWSPLPSCSRLPKSRASVAADAPTLRERSGAECLLSGRRASGADCKRLEGPERLGVSSVVVAVLELLLMSELPRFRLLPPEENTSSTLSRLERVRERPEPGESGFVAGKLSMPYEEAKDGRRQLGHQVKWRSKKPAHRCSLRPQRSCRFR